MRQSPSSALVSTDAVGAATLEIMALAPAYNRWTYDRIARWIGLRVLEIGAGIGNMSQYFVDRERVVLTDIDPLYRETLQGRFTERSGAERRRSNVSVGMERRSVADRRATSIEVVELSLPDVPQQLVGQQFDTIVCLNVLEHIEDDCAALETMRRLLEPGGHLILLVPALPFLYGELDRALGHFRRYTPGALGDLYAAVGLRMVHIEYFNLAGVLGWWFTGRVAKRPLIPSGSLRLYDRLVPLFRLERFLPLRVGQSLIAIGTAN